MHRLESSVGYRSGWINGLMTLFYYGLEILKEWRIVKLLRRHMKESVWEGFLWVDHREGGLIQ